MTVVNKIMKQGVIGVFLKIMSICFLLITTPILIKQLGPNEYGVWATIFSLFSWGVLFDLGIGSALIRLFNERYNEKEYKLVVCSLFIYSLIFSSLFLIVSIFSVDNIFIYLYICILPAISIYEKLLISKNKSHLVELYPMLAQGIFLGAVIFFGVNSAEDSAFKYIGISFIVRVLASVKYILKLKFQPDWFHKKELISHSIILIRSGLSFFFLQIMAVGLMSLERVIILWGYNGDSVTNYDLASKVYMLVLVFSNIFSRTIWGVTSSIDNSQDLEKMKLVIGKSFILLAVLNILLSVLVPSIVEIWSGIIISTKLSASLAIWTTCQGALVLFCNYVNGLGKQKTQIPFFVFGGFCKFVLIYLIYDKMIDLNTYIIASSLILTPYSIYVLTKKDI